MIAEVKSFIESNNESNTLFVLKGFSLESLGMAAPVLANIIGNKIAWLFQLMQSERKIVTFDEFVCLYDMMVSQFAKIYIVENPIYKNLHPLSVTLGGVTTSLLVEYFDEDIETTNNATELDEYTNIYSNFISSIHGIACCYNITDNQLVDVKIEIHEIELTSKPVLETSSVNKNVVRINLCNEADYFGLIQQLYNTENVFCISWDSYTPGKKAIEDSIYKVNAFFPDRIVKAKAIQQESFDVTELKSVMKNFWGYDEFRNIKIYDLDSVSKKEKETCYISQGEIIGNLVRQTEKCLRGENFRDIFVTAPTGAGKSLIFQLPAIYLGYVKRENIKIDVSKVEKKNKAEYELNKFDELISMINASLMRDKKTLIYFPTVALISRFYSYCHMKNLGNYVAMYHGQLNPDEKDGNFGEFHEGSKLIMLATKAFGMGIDIEDIAVVVHFAPTGNVCDYLQEIGRAARKKEINGLALYKHMSNDFKHINRLHGLSTIKKYQLIRVIEKILDLFNEDIKHSGRKQLKNRREMLIDTDNFSYIFESPASQNDDSDLMNKVKTALLLIQKDYENRFGYSPFYMRPIPMFKNGYFAIPTIEQAKLNNLYPSSLKPIYEPLNICEVDLNAIWQRIYKDKRDGISFPKFKYWLYSQNPKLDIVKQFDLNPAIEVQLSFNKGHEVNYEVFLHTVKKILNENARAGVFISLSGIANELREEMKINYFQAEGIVNVLVAAISIYQRDFNIRFNSKMFKTREESNSGKIRYSFDSSVRGFFAWVEKGFKVIKENLVEDKLYIVNSSNRNTAKEMSVILRILESARVLRFRSLGGSDSQIYLYL